MTVTGFPVDTWTERYVELPNGLRHIMVVDSAATDPLSQLYMTGDGVWLNAYLVRLMSALVKPGDRVVDLGTFTGEFALAAAAHGCEVLAVEANPVLAQMLTISAELNHFDGLRVLNAAAGDVAGAVEFLSHGPWGQVRSAAMTSDDSRYERVPQVTLDDLLTALPWESVAFVKIDVEGSEMRALAGASGLLSRPDAPALLVESNISPLMESNTEPRALLEKIEGFGYSLHRITPDEIIPCTSADFQAETVADYLALKGRTPADVGLAARAPLSVAETAARVLTEARNDAEPHRRSIAWQLRFASPELRSHPDVQKALAELREDREPTVRDAIEAVAVELPSAAPSPPDIDARLLTEQVLRTSAEARVEIAHRMKARPDGGVLPVEPPLVWPGPMALSIARRLSAAAGRHPRLAALAKRLIRLTRRLPH